MGILACINNQGSVAVRQRYESAIWLKLMLQREGTSRNTPENLLAI